MQLTKEIVFPAMEDLKACMRMTCLMIENISIKENLLNDEKYKYLFTVEAMNQLVKNGKSYRDAYREIGNLVDKGNFNFDYTDGLNTTHLGSISNPGLNEIQKLMSRHKHWE
jgi:argininosuccinate lyase